MPTTFPDADRWTNPLKAASPNSSVRSTVRAEPKTQDTAERRKLTVMFTDLVGSTALLTSLDPED